MFLGKNNITKPDNINWNKLYRRVKEHENIIIMGPTGAGKTWLACALAEKACREGHTVLYHRLSKLLYELAINKGEGSYLESPESNRKSRNSNSG